MSIKKFVLVATVIVAIVSILAACAPAATPAPAATEAPATQAPAPAATEAPAAKKFTIGISNSFISSEYRTSRIVAMSFCEPRSW